MKPEPVKSSARTRILDAALSLIREKGYSATTVDELCAEAGVTKGAFFHHFASKEDLGVSAAEHWSTVTNALFKSAPYQKYADPLDRVLGYVDFRRDILKGEISEYTCLVGTMVQETFGSHPAIRDACQKSIFGHAGSITQDIEAAKKLYAKGASWTSEYLALHIQGVLQGAFVLAKANDDSRVAIESIAHLRRYLEFLFNQNQKTVKKGKP